MSVLPFDYFKQKRDNFFNMPRPDFCFSLENLEEIKNNSTNTKHEELDEVIPLRRSDSLFQYDVV